MAGLEELKKKLEPLFDAEKGLSFGTVMDPSESYMVSTSSYQFICTIKFYTN